MVNGSRFASEPASLSARESQIPELPRSRSKQVADSGLLGPGGNGGTQIISLCAASACPEAGSSVVVASARSCG
jgi:hypothetical protein